MKIKLTTLACMLGLAISANASAATELEKLRSEVDALNAKAQEWEQWKAPKTLIHMAGYADVGYTDTEDSPGSFNFGTFSPIFHYQFSDMVMLEAELEFGIDEAGKSEVGVDYLTIDYFINDYMALIAGKFLSPLGQFRQNLHPSWINKMASAPVGFGHDQAAPNAEVGFMLKGGFPIGSGSHNYSLYVGNGPTLEFDGAGEIEMIETPGLNKDGEGKKVVGGRYGLFFPEQQLDIGLSATSGETSIRTGSSGSYAYETGRSYDALGFDFAWRVVGFDIRGEYIKQEVGDQATSVAPTGGEWIAWYVQAAYKFNSSNWEVALRHSNYDTPHASEDRNQSAIGVNYVFASNFIGKLNYELNENPNAGQTAEDRLLVQLAYGF
ncbi:MAG: hypothetical protein QM484_13265 [Woeseiaceae bacterium]